MMLMSHMYAEASLSGRTPDLCEAMSGYVHFRMDPACEICAVGARSPTCMHENNTAQFPFL